MNSALQSVLDKSSELRDLLATLAPEERDSRPVREAVASLQDFAPSPSKKRRTSQIQALNYERLEQLMVGLSDFRQNVLLSIVTSLGKRSETPTHNSVAFASFTPCLEPHPAHILKTYFTHKSKSAIESKILALLVTHAIDDAVLKGVKHTSVIAEWAQKSGQSPQAIKDVERLGRCCLGILQGNGKREACFDSTGFGLLAMLHEHTSPLKYLASDGNTLLQACKLVKDLEQDAARLAPAVRSSIVTTAMLCGVPTADTSPLGRVLAASTPSQDDAQRDDNIEQNRPRVAVSGGEIDQTRRADEPLVRDEVAEITTRRFSGDQTTRWSSDKRELSRDTMLWDLQCLVQGFQPHPIDEVVLLRATDRQYRWSPEGNKETITLHDTSISTRFANLFDNRDSLVSLLDTAVQNHTLVRRSGKIRSKLPCRPEVSVSLDCLALLCYACPRDEVLEPKFYKVAREVHPHFWSYLQSYFQDGCKSDLRWNSMLLHDVAEACIAIACAEVLDCSTPTPHAVDVVAKYLAQYTLPDHLRLRLANAQSVFLRRQGDYDSSDRVITEALTQLPDPDVRTAYLSGELSLSSVENAILRNEYERAERTLDAIDVADDRCLLLSRLRERKWTTKARIYRFTGRFQLGVEPLRWCLAARRDWSGTNQFTVVRLLADIYVEIQDYGSATHLLDECLSEMTGNQKTHTRAYNRLLLSQADLEIAQLRYDDAETILSLVKQAFKTRPAVSHTDELDHVRSMIASLRITTRKSAWPEALRQSTQAISQTELYRSFTSTNYYKGYIRKLRALSYLHLAKEDLKQAAACVQEPRHFMTGVGTFDRAMAHSLLEDAVRDCAFAATNLLQIRQSSGSDVT